VPTTARYRSRNHFKVSIQVAANYPPAEMPPEREFHTLMSMAGKGAFGCPRLEPHLPSA
jgi:hypothetical protein